jgi:glycolate oxidase FAD binding subunit
VGTLGLIAEVVLRSRPLPACQRWLAGPVDPFALLARLHRPASILWDGTTTWLLLDGHPADVAAQAEAACAAAALRPGAAPAVAADTLAVVDGPPDFPPHRWSLRSSELAGLPTDGGAFVAEVGVGVVHCDRPPPARPADPAVAELHRRVKALFDPTGRLAPGRSPLAADRAGAA